MTAFDPQRRRLLLGRFQETKLPRPPWALANAQFLQACTACGQCLDACPEQILVKAADGYPSLDAARGGCTFCGECRNCCPTEALSNDAERLPWLAQIGEDCLNHYQVYCRSCAESCPEDAIQLLPRPGGTLQIRLEENRCSGCGFCVRSCPADAVSLVHNHRPAPQPPRQPTCSKEPCP